MEQQSFSIKTVFNDEEAKPMHANATPSQMSSRSESFNFVDSDIDDGQEDGEGGPSISMLNHDSSQLLSQRANVIDVKQNYARFN